MALFRYLLGNVHLMTLVIMVITITRVRSNSEVVPSEENTSQGEKVTAETNSKEENEVTEKMTETGDEVKDNLIVQVTEEKVAGEDEKSKLSLPNGNEIEENNLATEEPEWEYFDKNKNDGPGETPKKDSDPTTEKPEEPSSDEKQTEGNDEQPTTDTKEEDKPAPEEADSTGNSADGEDTKTVPDSDSSIAEKSDDEPNPTEENNDDKTLLEKRESPGGSADEESVNPPGNDDTPAVKSDPSEDETKPSNEDSKPATDEKDLSNDDEIKTPAGDDTPTPEGSDTTKADADESKSTEQDLPTGETPDSNKETEGSNNDEGNSTAAEKRDSNPSVDDDKGQSSAESVDEKGNDKPTDDNARSDKEDNMDSNQNEAPAEAAEKDDTAAPVQTQENSESQAPEDGKSEPDSKNKTEEANPKKNVTDIFSSDRPIFDHVDWGNETTQQYDNSTVLPENRLYFGYGNGFSACRRRYRIDYVTHILNVNDVRLVLVAYGEMLRVHCIPVVMDTYLRFFDLGYAFLDTDHSIDFSRNAIFFVQPFLTYHQIDDLQELMELSAFSQVYVSWYKFPVASIDPTGEPMSDAGFIELNSRLHVLDVANRTVPHLLPALSFGMGAKLKQTLRQEVDDLRNIHGGSNATAHKRVMAMNTLAVTMGLREFLMEHPEDVLRGHFGCAHATFREFYVPKKPKYIALTILLGRMQIDW